MLNWKRLHRYQKKPGWCGPAVIQMILLAVGINKSQESIEKDVNLSWWGTTEDITIAYLSQYFTSLGYKNNSTLRDITSHINKGNIVILDWWDDLSQGEPDGHYSIAASFDSKSKRLTLVDPSAIRRGVWSLKYGEFKKRWYGYLDVNRKLILNRFLIWVDPQSKILGEK
jgi:ABC-type bacteriocin/lantibiotic exporter with double-glycine peptidase domain